MDNNKVQVITARFFEDPEWKIVEEMITSKMSSLEEISKKDLDKWAGNVEVEIKGRILAYDLLKDFLAETKLVNKEIPVYKNKFK